MKMKIRKATNKDWGEYLKIIIDKFSDENTKIPSKESIKKEFGRIMSSRDDILIIAEEDKKIIGYIHGKIKRNYWSSGGNIEYLFVSKDFRKKGIATKLIKEFISFLKKNKKFVKVTLNVNLKNINSIELYKKLGFETTSYVMRKRL
jgi:ribosomal protein S18 acetylase RimI-like enzyme